MGFAPIDLKQATVTITDGYSKVGAVNNAAGYITGSTTMVVDGFTNAVAVGDTFTLTGDTQIYTISAHSESTGATTSITFTPGLVIAATDNEVVTVGPHSLEIRVGEGNLTFSVKQNVDYVRNRGLIDTVKLGDQEPTDVNLDFIWDFLRSLGSGAPVTPFEAFTQSGNASTWVSSGVSNCEPYAVNIVVLFTPYCPGVQKERILFRDFRHDSLDGDLKGGTVSVKGKANVRIPEITRVA